MFHLLLYGLLQSFVIRLSSYTLTPWPILLFGGSRGTIHLEAPLRSPLRTATSFNALFDTVTSHVIVPAAASTSAEIPKVT
jgi:hypothetical protein